MSRQRRSVALVATAAWLLAGCTASASQPDDDLGTETITASPTASESASSPAPRPSNGPYPTMVDLDVGETKTAIRESGGTTASHTFRLVSVAPVRETNLSDLDPATQSPWLEARVTIEVDGRMVELRRRPYQMPVTFDGLRLYVENVKDWNADSQFEQDTTMTRAVRLSFVLGGEPWGPESTLFPIKDYRWRSSSYMNTWSSLVPRQSIVYYHAGEDYGAVPDRLEVVSPVDGSVAQSPLPSGDGFANDVGIESADGTVWWFSHMDTEQINPRLTPFSAVRAGSNLGRTGSYWKGILTPDDPHLHVEIWHDGQPLASYPLLTEAYLRDYPDPVLAVAGGYRSTVPGQAIELDATRSLTKDGAPVTAYSWSLHDGRTLDLPIVEVTYDKPGLYSEVLTVRNADGAESVDVLQVQVFDPARPGKAVYGWAYASPVRDVHPGTTVELWPRLTDAGGNVLIDFGDGSRARNSGENVTHEYRRPGTYLVTMTGSQPGTGVPVIVTLPVIVD